MCQTALRKGITQKPPGCLAFAAGIVADKIVPAGAAAVERYQIETRNRLSVAITVDTEDAMAIAGGIKGHKVVGGPTLAAIEPHRGPLLRTFIEMSQGRFQREVAIRIDPACCNYVRGLIEISIKCFQWVVRHPRDRRD